MVMYHYQPKQEYECDKIQRALDILKGVIAREEKTPHDGSTFDLLNA